MVSFLLVRARFSRFILCGSGCLLEVRQKFPCRVGVSGSGPEDLRLTGGLDRVGLQNRAASRALK